MALHHLRYNAMMTTSFKLNYSFSHEVDCQTYEEYERKENSPKAKEFSPSIASILTTQSSFDKGYF